MSYEIEFDRLVFTFDGYNEYGNDRGNRLLFIHKRGASNVVDNNDNIVRNWGFVTVGSEREVISHIATFANEIEGGYLRYQNGTTKIENYIKNWRKEKQIPISKINEYFHSPEVVINHPKGENYKEKMTTYQKKEFRKTKDNWRRTSDTVSGDDVIKYHHDITKEAIQVVNAMDDITGITMKLTEK